MMQLPSRYDLAKGLSFAGAVLFVAGFGIIVVRPDPILPAFGLCFLGALLSGLSHEVCCPVCGKSLMETYFLPKGNGWRTFWFRKNWRPERICSECGTRFARPEPRGS